LVTGIWLWFHLVGFQPVTLWQLMQFTLVGMCAAVLPVAALPLWQLAQLVALVNRLWSGLEPSQVAVLLWQFSHTVWPLWMAELGLAVTPKAVLAWQVAHWLLTDTLAWNCPGFQVLNPPLWQLSQLPMVTPVSDL
jgi:hypothetical protein